MSQNNQIRIENMPSLPYAIEESVNRLRVNMSFLGEDVKKKEPSTLCRNVNWYNHYGE